MDGKNAESKSKHAKEKHKKVKEESHSKKKEIKTDEGEKTGSSEEEDFKGRIDVHTLNYFKRVEKLIEEEFEDKESQELFLNNVLDQVGQGLRTCQLAKHRLTSKILETLLAFCNAAQYLGVFKSLLEDAVVVSDDRFGSHVIQKVITLIPNHINCDNVDVRNEIEEAVLKFATIIKKNISELMRSMYACHIISCLIQVLGGMEISDSVSRSRNSRMTRKKFFKKGAVSSQQGSSICDNLFHKSTKPSPESFMKTLHRIGKEILKDDNFGELLCHRNASPVIQTTLLTLKENDPKLCSKVCILVVDKSRLLEWKTEHEVDIGSSNARVPILFADEVGSHVMEKIFHVASQDLYELLFKKCFKNNLLQLSLHPLANYILQHMFSTISNKDMAEEALEEIIPFTEDILASGYMGVAVRIAELCLRFKCKQKLFTKALMKALHLPGTKEGRDAFLKLLLTLSTYDVAFEPKKEDEEENKSGEADEIKNPKKEVLEWKLTREIMNYHGACLAKTLFQFEEPKRVVKSFLTMKDEVLFLMNHEYGSFVTEEFISSQTVSSAKKKEFLMNIKANLTTMATHKFGSRVIDKLWSTGDAVDKVMIKEELCRSRSLLRGNMYGRIVLRNCGIESFQIKNVTTDVGNSQENSSKNVNEAKGNKALGSNSQGVKPDGKLANENEEEEDRAQDGHVKNVKGENKRKQAQENDLQGDESDIKKTKKNAVSKVSYDEEYKKLGVCVHDEDMEDSGIDSGVTLTKSKSIAKESSNEIEELFAKGKLITKGKKRTKGNINKV